MSPLLAIIQIEDLPAEDSSKLLVILILAVSFISILTIILIIKSKRALEDQLKVIERQNDEIQKKNEALGMHVQSLKELNNEKNNIISIAAHDLRTPLNNVEGLVNIVRLEEQSLSSEQKKYLEMMTDTIKKAKVSINNILDVHKIEAEFEHMVLTNEDVVKLVEEVSLTYTPPASQKGLKISLETDHLRGSTFQTDKNYFKQIVSNLLSNAIRFSNDDGEIDILITETDNTYRISVMDHGAGIPEDVKKRLFTPYSKVKQLDEEHVTGLGLTITRKLVEKLNGKLRFESEEGKGSTFTIEFFK